MDVIGLYLYLYLDFCIMNYFWTEEDLSMRTWKLSLIDWEIGTLESKVWTAECAKPFNNYNNNSILQQPYTIHKTPAPLFHRLDTYFLKAFNKRVVYFFLVKHKSKMFRFIYSNVKTSIGKYLLQSLRIFWCLFVKIFKLQQKLYIKVEPPEICKVLYTCVQDLYIFSI